MCMFSGPSVSAPPPPPPPEPPRQVQRAPGGPEGTEARRREEERRRAMRGSGSTIQTGGRGLETEEETARKTALGV